MYALPFWQGRVDVAGHTASLRSFTEQNPALYRYLDESMMPLNLGVAFAKDYGHAFVADTSDFIQERADESGVHFEMKTELVHTHVVGSPLHLRQVIQNVLSYAVKFTAASTHTAVNWILTERHCSWNLSAQIPASV